MERKEETTAFEGGWILRINGVGRPTNFGFTSHCFIFFLFSLSFFSVEEVSYEKLWGTQ